MKTYKTLFFASAISVAMTPFLTMAAHAQNAGQEGGWSNPPQQVQGTVTYPQQNQGGQQGGYGGPPPASPPPGWGSAPQGGQGGGYGGPPPNGQQGGEPQQGMPPQGDP